MQSNPRRYQDLIKYIRSAQSVKNSAVGARAIKPRNRGSSCTAVVLWQERKARARGRRGVDFRSWSLPVKSCEINLSISLTTTSKVARRTPELKLRAGWRSGSRPPRPGTVGTILICRVRYLLAPSSAEAKPSVQRASRARADAERPPNAPSTAGATAARVNQHAHARVGQPRPTAHSSRA